MATKKKEPAKGGKGGAGGKGAGKGAAGPKGGGKGGAGAPGGKGGDKKGGKAQRSQTQVARGPHPGAELPVPPPRLRQYYEQTVRPRMQEQFSLSNVHEIPKLEKIVINIGLGEAVKQPKLLDSVVSELEVIAGQRPVRTRAKKSIANFGLREGQEIGASVTLRGARMWEFLDRFISVTVPRIRDFRGLPTRSFDGRGNYSLGIKEQVIFPEINYDQVEQIHGFDLTFVTTTPRDDMAFALLRELGMPFRGDDRPMQVVHS